MSAATARAVPLRTDRVAPVAAPNTTRWLWLVPQRRRPAKRIPFAVILVVVLGGGLLGLLLLNTLVAQNSFTMHQLASQSVELQQREQLLAAQVQREQAPAALADKATRLGMVPGGPPAFLRLSDGKILGIPAAGSRPAARKPTASRANSTINGTQAQPSAAQPRPTSGTRWTEARPGSPR